MFDPFKSTIPTVSVIFFWAICVVHCQFPHYQEKYITLPVDQFNLKTNETFQLRYLINDTFTKGNLNAPILFYCGNEADIEFFAKESGFIWELGQKLKALVVFAEHRYFGKSLPFGDESMIGSDHYGYLTIEQALADFATLVDHLNGANTGKRPTIAIGGSHGGVLAAFFRMKYPHIVAGALASSAPMRKFSNLTRCNVYTKIVTNVFKNAYNHNCSLNVKKSWTVLKEVSREHDGVTFFNEVFNFCQPWTKSDEVDELLGEMYSMYWDMTQRNYPYEADIYTPLPANPVRTFCSHLDTEFEGRELVKAFRRALNVYTNPAGKKKCFEFSSRNVMKPHEVKAFQFQRCTEIIIAFCTGEDDMFPKSGRTFEDAVERCKDRYDIPIDLYVHRIRNHFGINDLSTATNIIFSNGLLDLWSGASILTTPNDQITVINIAEGAHHLDLRSSNELDPQSVINARRLEQYIMEKWINEFRRKINYDWF